jgi:hypothetical protein
VKRTAEPVTGIFDRAAGSPRCDRGRSARELTLLSTRGQRGTIPSRKPYRTWNRCGGPIASVCPPIGCRGQEAQLRPLRAPFAMRRDLFAFTELRCYARDRAYLLAFPASFASILWCSDIDRASAAALPAFAAMFSQCDTGRAGLGILGFPDDGMRL